MSTPASESLIIDRSQSISSGDLGKHLGVSGRYARIVLAFLEQEGFSFEKDFYGARRIPKGLVQAIYEIRLKDKNILALKALKTNPELRSYLSSSQQSELALLISLRADLSVIREALGVIYKAHGGSSLEGIDWKDCGLPELKVDL